MKNCLVYTVRNCPKHINILRRSLPLVRDNLLPFVPGLEFVIFYDRGTETHIQNMIIDFGITNKVFLREFTAGPPEYPDYIKKQIVGNKSYNNMCRFWAGVVFRDPQVEQYDYYMRLDCDSFITAPVGRNIFEDVNGKVYGHLKYAIMADDSPYSKDLNKTIKEFEGENKYIGTIDDVREGMLYYTNFEICNVKAIKESPYLKMFDCLDKSGGIYIHRWGDHIIRYAGLHLFFPADAVVEICGISYTHQTFVLINGEIKR